MLVSYKRTALFLPWAEYHPSPDVSWTSSCRDPEPILNPTVELDIWGVKNGFLWTKIQEGSHFTVHSGFLSWLYSTFFVSDLLENTEHHGIMTANVIQNISAHQLFHVSQPPLKVGWGHITNLGQWAKSQELPPLFPFPVAETLGSLCSESPASR